MQDGDFSANLCSCRLVGIGESSIQGMSWATFKIKFLEKYFPMTERNDKRKEFLELIQGGMTVREYTTKFECLSRFVGNLIDTQRQRINSTTKV